MKKFKAIIALLLFLLVATFAIQNAEVVEISFLIWSFSAPRAVVVLMLLFIGLILGILFSSFSVFKSKE